MVDVNNMALYKNKYRIESTRWQNWNYSNPGLYFITVCTKNRLKLLGKVKNRKMVLNENGRILRKWLLKIDQRYDNVNLDTWIIMPEHWHCIIEITDTDNNSAKYSRIAGNRNHQKTTRDDRRKMLLSKVIGYIKMNSAKHININMNKQGRCLWQKGFYDCIIRDRKGYLQIAKYIKNNPRSVPLSVSQVRTHPRNAIILDPASLFPDTIRPYF